MGYYPSGSDDLAENVAKNIKGADIVSLHKHGITAVGDDLQKVIDMIEVLDYYCMIAVASRPKQIQWKPMFATMYKTLAQLFTQNQK